MNVQKIPQKVTPAQARATIEADEVEAILLQAVLRGNPELSKATVTSFHMTDRDVVFVFERSRG